MKIPLRLLLEILETVQPALNEIKAGNRSSARPYVDRLRQLRSFTADHIQAADQTGWNESDKFYDIALEAAQVVNNSLAALELISKSVRLPEFLADDTDFHFALDNILPPVWDWERDVFIFLKIPHPEWHKVLRERRQERVLCVIDNAKTILDCPEGWLFVNNINDIDTVLQQWHPHFPKRHAIFEVNFDSSCIVEPHLQAVLDALVRESVNQKTVTDFSKVWVKQQYQNAMKAVVSYGISDLKNRICCQNVVIVSPGPSLSKNIEDLKVSTEKFIIIAVAQACPALAKHNIIPDFVIVIDPMDYSEVLSGFDCSKSALIVDDRCSPAFLQKEFRETFILSSHFSLCGVSQVTKEEYYVAKGGSVSVIAFGLALDFMARSITLIGQDLSVEDGFYYHRPGNEFQPIFNQNDDTVLEASKKHSVYKLPGYFGGEVRTKPDFWLYHFQLEKAASEISGGVKIFNATEGGAYISGFVHKPLNEVIAEMDYFAADCAPIHPLSDKQKEVRVCKLTRIHQKHIKICDRIDRICRDILRLLLEDGQCKQNSVEIDNLEKLIAAETNKLPMLSGLLQGELKYFESRLRQCTNLNENLLLSRLLYSQIKSAAAEYRDIVCAARYRK